MVHRVGAGPQVHKDRRDWHNLKGMLPFLWEFRGRALFALGCLVLSKVANVGIPVVLKHIVEHFERAKDDPAMLAAVLPLSLLLAYGLLKLGASLFNELRDIVFAKVDTEDQQQLAAMAGITSIPTLMAFRGGVLVFSQAGALPGTALEQLLDQVKGLDIAEVRRLAEEQQGQQGDAEPGQDEAVQSTAAHLDDVNGR